MLAAVGAGEGAHILHDAQDRYEELRAAGYTEDEAQRLAGLEDA